VRRQYSKGGPCIPGPEYRNGFSHICVPLWNALDTAAA
jgi:hypothetical protein